MTWREFSIGPGERGAYEITSTVARHQSTFQLIEILDTAAHGRALFLDGAPQSAESDEFIYHEALVQPALLAHPDPRQVLICGGGEGATLREVLRHPSVERAVMVDIDGELVELCRHHLPSMHQGAFDDRRAELVVGDALAILRDRPDQYDAIIIDLTDPSDEGPAATLYGRDFYELAKSRLATGGILAVQSYAFGPGPACQRWLGTIVTTLSSQFGFVRPYRAEVPFFKDSWAFCTASDTVDPLALPGSTIDDRIAARGVAGLRFYDGVTHGSIFALPRYARLR
ncbi:MAG: spermidine synthase [Chloroflexota bacterium]